MDQLTILTWAIGGGFAGTWAMMLFMFNSINQKIDRLDARVDRLENRLEKLEEKVMDIDRRLCRIEGAMTTSLAYIHEKPKAA